VSELLPIVTGILALGILAQVLASRFEVPSVLFLILIGVGLGPEGLDVVTLETFGDGLSTVVGVSVAIILFDGGLHLSRDQLNEAPSAIFRLVTVGAAVMLVGTSLAVYLFLNADPTIALLIGSLLVATGPTVITPILQVVPVRNRVAAALETEGIVNDVTAAILAVVVFQVVNPESTATGGLLADFTARLGTGVLVGMLVAAVVYYLLRYIDLSPGRAPQNARLLVLAGALVAFAVANYQRGEAGVAAVATAGMLLGNADVPYEEEIEAFKGDITLIVLSFVFIALAALLSFDTLAAVGPAGLAVVAAVALVIRPVLVFVSTVGGRFTVRERLFMSGVGPRGIIPASVATLFAVELANLANEATGPEAAELALQADLLVGTVFLVIFATVAFEGGLARYVAEYLDVIPMRVIIVGGGQVGRALADRLADRGENVVIVEDDEEMVEHARNAGFSVEWGDGTDTDVLRAAGAENAKIVVAATGDDDANLLVAQLAKASFDVEQVFARANNPDNVDAFEELGVRTISSSMAAAWAIDNQIERPGLANWMNDVDRVGDVQEVEVGDADIVGKTVREVGPLLPEGCLIVLHERDGEVRVPAADDTIERGDRLTLVGSHEGVREGMALCATPE